MVSEKTPGSKAVRVRPATPADLPRLVEIAAHSATAAQWDHAEYLKLFAAPAATPSSTEQSAGTNNNQQARTALVVEQDSSVAGFIVARQIADEWEIENIAVTGQARRCGLGTRLLGEFLNLVRQRGGKTVFLEVRESNLAARALYGKWAFLETGRRKMYYQNPVEDALLLKFNFP
ncbi:MAG TPA: ribosomal protein S18-alanine N-acetyltransferase [Candidatus Angelobacter sp.]|nr:ribosomal protein S18-alanine N-acetyltransferase [Candidatus Angelobacter sp.]